LRGLFNDEVWTGYRSTPQHESQNCVAIAGSWMRNTRYQLQLSVVNPKSSSLSEPAPGVWVSVMTGELGPTGHLNLRVAGGGKFGNVCSIPEQRKSAMSTAFNACMAAHKAGAIALEGNHLTADCIEALRTTNTSEVWADALEHAQLAAVLGTTPLVDVTQLSGVSAASCLPEEAFSSRLGGECISCQPGVVTTNTGAMARPDDC
jgi:hypothetical protein